MNADELYLDLIGHLEARRQEQARAGLAKLAELEPDSQRVAVAQAHWWENQGDLEQARQGLEAYVAQRSDNGIARANLARLQYRAGERATALSTLRFALTLAPNQERSLHLYAALLQEDGGLQAALEALRLLAQPAGAWLPAWVGAQLALAHDDASHQAVELLLVAARRANVPFPPHPDALRAMFTRLPATEQRTLAMAIRSFCRPDFQPFLDAVLADLGPPARSSAPPRVTLLNRSVWRHLAHRLPTPVMGVGPISVIRPESWGVVEIAGRLGRGYALLLGELLDAIGGIAAVVPLESHLAEGWAHRQGPLPGALLASQTGSRCPLISAYLSYSASAEEFVLDADYFDPQGAYTGRVSCRAQHPGACVQELALRIMDSSALAAQPPPRPPRPGLEIDDALARETVASLILCAEGALRLSSLGNPGMLLDHLVEYAVGAQSEAAMLTLWAGVEAAARAGLEAGIAQRVPLRDLLLEKPALAGWIEEKV